MIDAAVDLFGPIDTVYAEVAARTTTAEDLHLGTTRAVPRRSTA
jgi:hypothetical protein